MPETNNDKRETICSLHETNIYLCETLMLHNQGTASEE